MTAQETKDLITTFTGVLASLNTVDKTNLVNAINEALTHTGGGGGVTQTISSVAINLNQTII